MEEDVTVNILGSCVSRTIFNKKFGKTYSVEGYVQRSFIFDIFETVDEKYQVTEEEIAKYKGTNFDKRSLATLINGTAREKLLFRKGEWIVLDTHYCGVACALITYPDKSKRIIQSDFIDAVKKVFQENEKFKECTIESIDAFGYIDKNLKNVIEFLKENWGSKIILIDCPRTPWYLSENGDLKTTGVSYVGSVGAATQVCELLLKNIDCYFVRLPSVVIGDHYHNYHSSSVHYVSEIYDYLKEIVDVITDKNQVETDKNKRMNILLLKYENVFQQMLLGEYISEFNSVQIIRNIVSKSIESRYHEMHLLCDKLCSQGNAEGYRWKSNAYRDGKGVEKNIDTAIIWMKKAVDKKPLFINELVDILQRSTNLNDHEEAFKICSETTYATWATGYLARAYRDGKGVEKDVDRAIELMRTAVNKNVGWAKKELDEMLNDCFEMIQ
jgi:Sel1 repeat.